jgi:hypothetical protein
MTINSAPRGSTALGQAELRTARSRLNRVPSWTDSADTIAFGIGCFLFEVPTAEDPDPGGTIYSLSDYVRDVRKALEQLPTISNLSGEMPYLHSIGLHRYPWNPGTGYVPHAKGPHPGGTIRPSVGGGGFTFDIHVPARWQESTFGGYVGTEDFRVDHRFADGFPVTFISMAPGTKTRQPASFIVAVREFLESEFDKRREDTKPLMFCTIGPSPMWVECFVLPFEGAANNLEVVTVPSRGYDDIYFRYSPDAFDGPAQAYSRIKNSIQHELSLYYQIVNDETDVFRSWTSIDADLASLVALHKASGVRRAIQRAFTAGRLARALSLSILEQDSEVISLLKRTDDAIERMYANNDLPAFQSMLLKHREHIASVARPRAADIVSFLDTVHARSIQAGLLVASSLLGGVAGAAITAVASGSG